MAEAKATEAKIDAAKAEAAAEKAYAQAAAAVEAKAEAAAPLAAKAAPAPAKLAKTPIAKKAAPTKVAAKKPVKAAAPKKPAAATKPTLKFKDMIMTKTQTVAEDFTAKLQETVTEAQDRAKLAFEKSQALFGEAGEFTKGNVEALVESGKILAAGVQGLGKDYVAEAKTAFETVQADVKDLAAVKSPADFFKLQGEILRRNFDAVVASGSKHSEVAVKLANEAFAPIQNRVAVAIEKVKKAA